MKKPTKNKEIKRLLIELDKTKKTFLEVMGGLDLQEIIAVSSDCNEFDDVFESFYLETAMRIMNDLKLLEAAIESKLTEY